MAYTTVDDLAGKLKVRVTPENTPALQACIDAAAEEIDHHVDRPADSPLDTADPLAGQVNLARAVEWWKAADAAFGSMGMADTGNLRVTSAQALRFLAPFTKHALDLTPLRAQWGVS